MPKKLRVLIVEDHAEDAELMALRLEEEGFQFDWRRVERESEYLEALETKPNLILADWSLPQFSGLRAFKLMKERGEDIPFILVTGSIGEELAVAAMQEGVYDYVLKDRTARLGQAVRHALDQKKLRQKRRMAEEALRESEELYRQLFEAESDAIVLIDKESGRILEANEAAAVMYGYSRDDLLAKKNTDLSAEPEETRRITQTTPLDAEQIVTIPLQYHRRSDGTVFPVEITARFFNRKGRGVHIAAVRDITERKQAEAELRASEARFSTVFRSSPVGISVSQFADAKFIDINNAFLNMTGFTREEVIDQTAFELNFWADPEERDTFRRTVLDQGRINNMEIQFRKKSGEFGDALASAELIDLGGERFMLSLFNDITDRKQAEEKLRETLAELTLIHENAPIAMILVDRDRRVIKANGAAAAFAGRTPEEMVGLRGGEALRCLNHLDDPQGCGFGPSCPLCPVRLAVQETFATGRNQQDIEAWLPFSVEGRRESRCLLVSTSFLQVEDTKRVLVCAQDITDRKQAEEALRVSEARFATVFRSSPIAISISRFSDSELVDVNDAFVKMSGYARQELVGRPVLDLNLWVDPGHRAQVAKTLIDQGRVQNIELQFRRKSGEIGEGLASAELIELGGEQYMLSLVNDITERKRVQAALERSESMLRVLVEGARDGILAADAETRKFIIVNEAACRMFGYSREEMLSLGMKDIHPEQDLPRVAEVFERQLRGELALSPDIPAKRKDGSVFYVDVNATPVQFGGQHALIGVFRDITDRKRAEERIRHLNRVLRAIRDVNRLIAWAEEPQQLIQEICQVLVDTRGYQSAKIILTDTAGRPETYAKAGIGEAFEPLAASLDQGYLPPCCAGARDRDDVYLVENRERVCAPCPISDQCLATDTMSVRLKHQDTVFGYLAVAVDHALGVDEEEQSLFADLGGDLAYALYNLEMRQAKQRAEEAQKKLGDQLTQAQKMEAVGRLAGGVAHDFNNMLSVILGYTEGILSELKPMDPIYRDLSEVQAAAERSVNLTRQLLAFSRRQTIAPQVIDLKDQMKGIELLLRRIIGEDIDLEFILPGDVWSVKMDPSQLDQIVANLAVNARDAMPEGGKMTIEVGNVTLDEAYFEEHVGFSPGDYVLLALSDTGFGMDKETLAHVFEPFFTTKVEGQGTGLGLSMVYGIAKQNNGLINIYSELDQGTTIKIYLPRYEGPEQRAAKATATRPVRAAVGGQETILLVEDEEQVRRLAKTILERAGYKVLEAQGPGEAIALCERHSGAIDLLLTDVVMPNMNGKDLEAKIRALTPRVKALFMSGYTANAIAHRGVLEKGIHFIQKPFSLNSLTQKVRAVLDEE